MGGWKGDGLDGGSGLRKFPPLCGLLFCIGESALAQLLS